MKAFFQVQCFLVIVVILLVNASRQSGRSSRKRIANIFSSNRRKTWLPVETDYSDSSEQFPKRSHYRSSKKPTKRGDFYGYQDFGHQYVIDHGHHGWDFDGYKKYPHIPKLPHPGVFNKFGGYYKKPCLGPDCLHYHKGLVKFWYKKIVYPKKVKVHHVPQVTVVKTIEKPKIVYAPSPPIKYVHDSHYSGHGTGYDTSYGHAGGGQDIIYDHGTVPDISYGHDTAQPISYEHDSAQPISYGHDTAQPISYGHVASQAIGHEYGGGGHDIGYGHGGGQEIIHGYDGYGHGGGQEIIHGYDGYAKSETGKMKATPTKKVQNKIKPGETYRPKAQGSKANFIEIPEIMELQTENPRKVKVKVIPVDLYRPKNENSEGLPDLDELLGLVVDSAEQHGMTIKVTPRKRKKKKRRPIWI